MEHRPHDRDWMMPTRKQREYGEQFKQCSSCGIRHDNEFIGKDYCLNEEELKYLNLTDEEKEERNNIIKYNKLYYIKKDKFGLTGL